MGGRDEPVLGVVGELARVARARVGSGDLGGEEREGEEVVHVPAGFEQNRCKLVRVMSEVQEMRTGRTHLRGSMSQSRVMIRCKTG